MQTKTTLETALEYEKLGWSIFPVGKDKRPLLDSWLELQSRRSTPEEIKKWYTLLPDAGIAVVTGKISNITVLDIDAKHNRSPKEFKIPPTVSSQTGGGGVHIFFKYHPSKSSNGQLFGLGVDLKSDGGYVVLSPSIHNSGKKYEWMLSPSNTEMAEVPEWLIQALDNNKNVEKLWKKETSEVTEGNRNETAASIAGKIRQTLPVELRETVGWPGMLAWNMAISKPLPENELRGIWQSIAKYDTEKSSVQKNEIEKESIEKRIIDSILNNPEVKLFHDDQNDAYISAQISGHQEIWQCKSKALKRLLSMKCWELIQNPLRSESARSIITTLEGKACFEGPKIKLQNRSAWHGDDLWYDLTNQSWQSIKINEQGWEIVNKPPILFKRYSHSQEQITPSTNGNINLLLNYINITDNEQKLLLLVFLVSCFIPDFAHVILIVFGSQGSAKSTLSKLLRLIVDPSLIEVASMPDNQKELIQTLAHHAFLFFDNVSYISESVSDTLCKAVTGSGFPKRELYSDDEDVIYSFKRCIGINGINLVATRPDLLERSLLIELERISPHERREDKELKESFEKDLPVILGGVLDILVKALKIKKTLILTDLPRMADFASWGCAITEALGYDKEIFLKAYRTNIDKQIETALNENIVATALISFMENKEKWNGTPTDLFRQLSSHAWLQEINTYDKYWPKAANKLSQRLNELSVALQEIGIVIRTGSTNQEREITITKLDNLLTNSATDIEIKTKPLIKVDDGVDTNGTSQTL